MKNKLFCILILIITLLGISLMFTGLLLSSYKTSDNTQSGNDASPYPINYVPYSISEGTVSKSKSINATVQPKNAEDEIIEFSVESGIIKEGDYYSRGTTVGNYTFQYSGRILDVVQQDGIDKVRMINYCNRKFVFYIKNSDLQFFKYGTEHVIYSGNVSCRANVVYIDQLLEESTKDAIKVELEIIEESLKDNNNLFLLLNSEATIYYDKHVQDGVLRCSKSAFESEELIQGSLVKIVVKKKSSSEYVMCVVELGLIGDSHVQIISEYIEAGDVLCV